MANEKDVKRARLGVVLAGAFDAGLGRLARPKTDSKASGGVDDANFRTVASSLADDAGIVGAAAMARRSVKD